MNELWYVKLWVNFLNRIDIITRRGKSPLHPILNILVFEVSYTIFFPLFFLSIIVLPLGLILQLFPFYFQYLIPLVIFNSLFWLPLIFFPSMYYWTLKKYPHKINYISEAQSQGYDPPILSQITIILLTAILIIICFVICSIAIFQYDILLPLTDQQTILHLPIRT
ncbi:MAG: hypothetical protein ACFFAE_16200 [Candidatus Hodarchaeota archaeon]